jgi:type II secretory pathway component GspD/PulD (secretin)
MNVRPFLVLLTVVLVSLAGTRNACAQLATSFYNVTGIETKVLPNAVRIVIRTDGTVRFGSDLSEWIDFDTNFGPKPTTSFRIRLPGARAKLPAFVGIGTYPVDAAVVTPGRVDFEFPYFQRQYPFDIEPRVDIELRFFVPVRVQRLVLEENNDITFSRALGPLDTSIELGQDRQSIIITVVPDRTDFNATERLRRSPAETHNHRLSFTPVNALMMNAAPLATAPVEAAPSTRYRIDVLHTPLAQVLDAAAQAMNLRFINESRAENALNVDVSLFLPDATPQEFLNCLTRAYSLVVTPGDESGTFIIGDGGNLPIERIQLQNLAPERARLLLPDFLLPLLRTDIANSALLITAPPQIIERVRRDLAKLDVPRPQVRVDATAWEFTSAEEMRRALSVGYAGSRSFGEFNTATGGFSFEVSPEQQRVFRTRIDALVARGRARLAAKPFVVVASGETGTLFLGQTRFIPVLRQIGGVNEPTALRLQIGYTLTVTPRVGATDDIRLDLAPRVSTVDEIEVGSGLPTLGIRETSSVVRVRPDEAVILGGLDTELSFQRRGRSLPSRIPLLGRLFRSRSQDRANASTLLLVTARKV